MNANITEPFDMLAMVDSICRPIQVNDGRHIPDLIDCERDVLTVLSPALAIDPRTRIASEIAAEVLTEMQQPVGQQFNSGELLLMLTQAARKGYASGHLDGIRQGMRDGVAAYKATVAMVQNV